MTDGASAERRGLRCDTLFRKLPVWLLLPLLRFQWAAMLHKQLALWLRNAQKPL
jgi:hypothetical protein